MLPFVLNNSRYFSHSGPAVCLLLQGTICNLLTTGGRVSLCFKGRAITVRAVNDFFFFFRYKCKPHLIERDNGKYFSV